MNPSAHKQNNAMIGKRLSPILFSKSRNRIHRENISYIYIATFNEEGLLDDFDIFMDQMMHTKGLIIDLRRNSGGLLENIDQIVGRFIQSPLAYPKGFSKGNVPCYKSVVQPKIHKPWYVNPVILLINGAATSGGDVIAELMKQIPNVMVVGDTTNGAGCTNHPDDLIESDYFLPSGKFIHVGVSYILCYDGMPIEWNVIPPDIHIVQTKTDMKNGRDKQLEYAIELLR